MARLLGRRCTVLVQPPDPTSFVETLPGGVALDGLRCAFKVTKSLEQTPNQCVLTVYNLSKDRRAQLQKKGTKVFLQAGYTGTVRQIFSGDARLVQSKQQGPDWMTEFQCGDGERAYRFARFSETYRPGTSVEQVVRALAAALNIDASNAVQQVTNARGPAGLDQFVYGYAYHGKASDALGEILRSVGLSWSIQDGKLQVLSSTDVAQGQVVVISKESGMVDSPVFNTPKDEEGAPTLSVKTLLQPAILCGGSVEIRSESVNGQFKVLSLTHEGDTNGGPWHTSLELEAL